MRAIFEIESTHGWRKGELVGGYRNEKNKDERQIREKGLLVSDRCLGPHSHKGIVIDVRVGKSLAGLDLELVTIENRVVVVPMCGCWS